MFFTKSPSCFSHDVSTLSFPSLLTHFLRKSALEEIICGGDQKIMTDPISPWERQFRDGTGKTRVTGGSENVSSTGTLLSNFRSPSSADGYQSTLRCFHYLFVRFTEKCKMPAHFFFAVNLNPGKRAVTRIRSSPGLFLMQSDVPTSIHVRTLSFSA